MTTTQMVKRKTWEEFRETKLLWWINRILHTFGWAICVDVSSADKGAWIMDVYPARVKFRGFESELEDEGFIGLTEYLKGNMNEIALDLSGETKTEPKSTPPSPVYGRSSQTS